MEVDSQSLTPPGSPILGFRDTRSSIGTGEYGPTKGFVPARTFSCKGPLRPQDKNFSPEGYLLRNEILVVLNTANPLVRDKGHQFDLYTFFDCKFDPWDRRQLRVLIQMCRKRICTLENLARTSFAYGLSLLSNSRNIRGSRDEGLYGNPYKLRRDICTLLNFLVARRKDFTETELHDILTGLIKSLGSARQWASSLQHHCGSKDGNECSSPEYHLFHVNLELRWSLLIIFGMRASVLNWVLEDLLFLVHLKFKSSDLSLTERTPFSCYCVKELWAMVRIMADQIKPNGRDFWDIITTSLTRFDSGADLFFPLWIISNLVELMDYDDNGILNKQERRDFSGSNCYTFVNQLLNEWVQRGGKTIEVHQLVHRLLPYWGFDLNITLTLWTHWLPRIDRGFEVRNMDPYSGATKWLRLISWICTRNSEAQFEPDPLASDPFLNFVQLLADHTRLANLKDRRKIKSSICNRLSPKTVEGFSENGLIRLTTMLLCLALASVVNSDALDMCERLNEILSYGKESLELTKCRGRCSMVLLLLEKSVNVSGVSSKLMRSVDEVMGTIGRSPWQKDVVMVYLDFLENLPKYSPELDLGQSSLIGLNLTAWLSSCGPNYVSRTLRSIHTLFEAWLLNSDTLPSMEKSAVANLLQEKTEQFLKQTVTLTQNRSPDCDIQPYAELAADLTFLQKSKQNSEAVNKLFDLFALNARTCPQVTEVYLDRIINSRLSSDSISAQATLVNSIQLTQGWLRVVTLGCSVPLKLSACVLNSTCDHVMRLNNDLLLGEFCNLVNSPQSPWTRKDLTTILAPFGVTVKSTVEKVYDMDERLIDSIIKSSVIILKHVSFDKIYLRSCPTSLVHHMLDAFVPSFIGKPPWEKISQSFMTTLGKYLHELFLAIIATETWTQDPFLKRKLCDIYRFAFLGYPKAEELEESNPALRIMQHCETMNAVSVQVVMNEIIPSLQLLAREDKLTKRFIMTTIGFLKRRMALTTVSLLNPIIEILVEKGGDLRPKCTSIVANTCSLVLGREINTQHVPAIHRAFQATMSKHFSFQSKRFFDLFISISTFAVKKAGMRKYFIDEILPLINSQILVSEDKQGSGVNYAMRSQLKQLEVSLLTPSV